VRRDTRSTKSGTEESTPSKSPLGEHGAEDSVHSLSSSVGICLTERVSVTPDYNCKDGKSALVNLAQAEVDQLDNLHGFTVVQKKGRGSPRKGKTQPSRQTDRIAESLGAYGSKSSP
jgi:hypothetical protein